MRSLVIVLCFLSVATAQFQFSNFSGVAGWTLNGNAIVSGSALRLTEALPSQGGSAFFSIPETVVSGFDYVFEFQLGGFTGGGADGFCFVLHGDPRLDTALGVLGGQLSYGSTPMSPPGTAIANSLVVEFDTFQNGQDLSGNEISVHTGGIADNSAEETFSIGRVSPAINLSDGQRHFARVRYAPGLLEVFLDNLATPLLSIPYDFATGGTYVLGGSVGGLNLIGGTSLFAGFTASTGGSAEFHDILSLRAAPFGWQTNSPGASLTIDGVQSDGISGPARTQACIGGPITFDLNSTAIGFPFDVGVQIGSLTPNVFSTANGQIVNISVGSPLLVWAFSASALPNFLTPFLAPLNIPASAPAAAVPLGFQSIHLNPAVADGFSLSQGAELETLLAGSVNGPTGDDSFTQVVFTNSPLCAPNDMVFYGTVFTSMFVNSNGRVTFGAGDTDFSASVAEAIGDAPMIGAWIDFNPAGSNAITVDLDPNTFEVVVNYGSPTALLNYFGTTTGNSFQVRLDTLSGFASLTGLSGLQNSTASGFLGTSGGNLVFATNAGATSFAATSGSTANGTDMLYEFGTFGPGGSTSMNSAGLINTILFVPNGFGNYDFAAF